MQRHSLKVGLSKVKFQRQKSFAAVFAKRTVKGVDFDLTAPTNTVISVHGRMVAWSAHTSAADADDEEWLRLEAVRKLRRLNAAAMEKRRRIKAALLALDGGQGPQGGKRREESPFSWDDHISQLTEQKFKLRYRLTFDGFNKLLDNGEFGIRGDLEAVDTKMAKRAKWGYLVSAETKLAICLRYLAGASILDLELIYKVSSSYAYQCV